MGLSNCTRVLVYSAVSSRAAAQTPASSMHSAVVAYSVMQSIDGGAVGASRRASRSAPTRTPSSSTIASGARSSSSAASASTPVGAAASTMKTPRPLAAPSAVWQVAGTRMASATKAAGTQALVPSSTHEPSAWAVAVVAGSVPPGRITSPDQLGQGGGEDGLAAGHAGQPGLALRVGAEAVDGQRAVDHRLDHRHVGRGAARPPPRPGRRPRSRARRRRRPRPGGCRAGRRSASSLQSSRSNGPSSPAVASTSFRRSCVDRSVKICPASSRTASCSSL